MESIWEKIMYWGLEFLGLYYSSYRGFVVDNNDPENLGRVKVIFPHINPTDSIGTWAYPKNNFSGNGYGSQLLPVKGDMVWIEFDHGNTEFPLWSHGHYGENEKPEEFEAVTDIGLKTPKRNLILIKDGITSDDGKILCLFKTGNEYFLIEKNKFELESSLIKLGRNGDEWALMGETTRDKMDDILDLVIDMADKVATHVHPTTAPYAPTSVNTSSTDFVSIKADLTFIQENLDEILSGKVKIDR